MTKSVLELTLEYLPIYTAHVVMDGDPMLEPVTEFRSGYFFLSNFYLTPITYDGYLYPSLEHAFQASKTLNLDERLKIVACETPGQAKRMGKEVTLRSDWEQVKISIMRELLYQKFRDTVLRIRLLETRGRVLIEGNDWGDTFWGQCEGQGLNVLGNLLMEVREHLQSTGMPFAG